MSSKAQTTYNVTTTTNTASPYGNYSDGYFYAVSPPVYSYPYTLSMVVKKTEYNPIWKLKEKDLYNHENVRVIRSKKHLYEIHTDRYVVLVNSNENAIRIHHAGLNPEILLEMPMSPYDAFSMFTQHSDGEILYANAFDINVKIENMLLL